MSTDTTIKPDQFKYLDRVLTERLNVRSVRTAQIDFEANFDILRYKLSETESELSDARNSLAGAFSDLVEVQNKASQIEDRLAFVTATLTNNLRHPWKPVKDAISRRLAYVMITLCKPFSERNVQKFRRSAAKRNPRRYEGTGMVASLSRKDAAYVQETHAIIEQFLGAGINQDTLHLKLGSGTFVKEYLEAFSTVPGPFLSQEIGFSIVTPYYEHESFFADCAKSVEAAMERSEQPVEWVVFNDDPRMPDVQLRKLIPDNLSSCTRIISDGLNHGIARGQNKAIAAVQNPWIILLDCDDLLEPQALKVLGEAIKVEPTTRYFTSSMTDINDEGDEIRRRRQDHALVNLFSAGMVAGHMVAIRKDLFEELGGFDDKFSGVQDFDFALRVAAQERITRLPEYLYRYRWHSKTQSVGSQTRQSFLANAVRTSFLHDVLDIKRSPPISDTPLIEDPRALCVIRTQGGRMDFLMEAIASVNAQEISMIPCIVVHGTEGQFDFVEKLVADAMDVKPFIILHAGEGGKRRGYPCNVALNYLRSHRDSYDLLCFLDDDDHYLPGFSRRLTDLLRATNADLAYGLTNALPSEGYPIAQHGLLPSIALLGGNFMPFNSFMVRTEAVFAAQACFDETLHYLEDYDFLVQILGAGARLEPLMETVAEYRLLGDGNSQVKEDSTHFEHCEKIVRSRAHQIAFNMSQEEFWANIAAFPSAQRKAFSDQEMAHLGVVRDMFSARKAPQ